MMLPVVFLQNQRAILERKRREYGNAKKMRVEGTAAERIRFKVYVLYPRILAALRRIDEGTYGLCQECQDSIDVKRLTAVPAAIYCVACQSRRDVRVG